MTHVMKAGRHLRKQMSPWAIALLAVITAVAFTIPFLLADPALGVAGAPSGNGVQPEEIAGNPSCTDVLDSDEFLFEFKHEPVTSGTFPLTFDGLTGSVTVVVSNTGSGQVFSFSFSGDFVAAGVIVKGGPNANFYDYTPDGEDADTGLHAPVNPNNNRFYGLSHISFCVAEAGAEIDIVKTAVDDEITVGEKAAFDITVTGLGPATAQNVTIDDELPNTTWDWEIVAEDILGACSITGGNTLHCDVGDLAEGDSFSVRVQTTTAATAAECDTTLDNTAFAEADNADEVDDDATITVECGAIKVNKFAKDATTHEDPDDTVPVAGAGFTLFDEAGTTAVTGEETTGTDGVACFDGLPLDTTFKLRETTTPAGYATVADQSVATGSAHTDCGDGNEVEVDVENTPLTDLLVEVEAQVDDATHSSIECVDASDNVIGSAPLGDPVSVDVDDLEPGTYVCTIVIDP